MHEFYFSFWSECTCCANGGIAVRELRHIIENEAI